ncbi:cardiolipin synthase [Paenibacillus shirakamiensis]|uniref:Cardiolipin synthase n=1 Tax=Paenibacillus shirakamiensis TaxID=1265935 RepID=A0ABS4JES3_9BACL|nr:phosphatidylserine/phosphatidylglycerophosphate/cardiolipin synthase family protein [Paenibacillus shirakamiensis]MBP2000205.1 cardiolipin synthase [Paenibacillus shirakamiensis]
MNMIPVPDENMNEIENKDLLDFINYYLWKGPIAKVVDGAEEALALAERCIPFQESVKWRQALGGIFTSVDELCHIPGIQGDDLKQLAVQIEALDLTGLRVLMPFTTKNNRVDAYVNGPDCLHVILDEIHKAKRYIHMSVMLFFNDRSGNQITQALLDALHRGVQVRLMVNTTVTAIGYGKNLKNGNFTRMSEPLKSAGAQIMNTFESCYSNKEWAAKREELKAKGVSEANLIVQDYIQKEITTGLNVINHRKFIVIDGISAIIGSINVGDQYLFDTPLLLEEESAENGMKLGIPSRAKEWHDGCFRIQGAAAQSLNEVFSVQWSVLDGDLFDTKDSFYHPQVDLNFGEEECTVFASFPGNPVNLIQQYYLSLISYAASDVIIVNPYLIDKAFWDRLKSLDEVQSQHITICNPLRVNDHPTNKSAVRGNMYEPFHKGVAYYDYSKTKRFSHWKINYDKYADSIFHGSYNMNERSACHDFEVGILVKGKAFAQKVKRMIDYDLSVSEHIKDSKEFFKHPSLHISTYFNRLTSYFT